MKTMVLVTLLHASPVLADPSATLLPREAPAAALDFSGNRRWIAAGIVTGAALTALATVLAIVLSSHGSNPTGLLFPTTIPAANGPR